ncbi:hypothetical protein ACJJTC_000822 [Scirpophaga incertulas]
MPSLRFSKCLRVNMKKDAVQHERAPRPGPATVQHQFALQKLGYNFSRQQSLFSTPTPLSFTGFSSLHSYPHAPHHVDSIPSIHGSYLENSIHDFSATRLSENIPSNMSQMSPLLSTQVGPLSSLSPFKFPLFSNPLHYSMPHPGYFPTNIIYPATMQADTSTFGLQSTCNTLENRMSQAKFSSSAENAEKPDSELSDRFKENEVSSSEEALKAENEINDTRKEGSYQF